MAMIQVLYCDTARVLKIKDGVSASFEEQKGVTESCPLSRMLYSLSIKPLHHELREGPSVAVSHHCDVSFRLSVYGDYLFCFSQNYISVLEKALPDFEAHLQENWILVLETVERVGGVEGGQGR